MKKYKNIALPEEKATEYIRVKPSVRRKAAVIAAEHDKSQGEIVEMGLDKLTL